MDTGLLYASARYYNPAIGRFVSQDEAFRLMGDRDSLSALIGDETLMDRMLMDPQQLNSYSYAKNNPVTYVDKSGHAVESVVDVIVLALSTREFYQNRTFWNGVFVGLDGLGLAAPFIPSGVGYVRHRAKAIKIANYFNRVAGESGKSALHIGKLFAQNISFKFTRKAWSTGEAGDSLGNLVGHFAKHGDSVGAKNVKEYYNIANDVVDSSSNNVFHFTDFKGEMSHYDKSRNLLVVVNKNNQIKTMHKVNDETRRRNLQRNIPN